MLNVNQKALKNSPMPDRTFSLEPISLVPPAGERPQYVIVNRPLDRILAFTGYSIDDIIDNQIARQTVYGFFKVHKQILRSSETVDLERQWNPLKLATP